MEDRMRICLISFSFAPLIGGAEAQVEKQARALQALGHDVSVVTLCHKKDWQKQEELRGLRVLRVGGIYRRSGTLRTGRLGIAPILISLFLTLWRVRHSYDVLHVFQVSPLAAAATLLGTITHKPTILNIQSSGPDKAQLARIQRGATLMADTLTDTDFLQVDSSIDLLTGVGDIDALINVSLGGRAIAGFLRRSRAFYQVLSTRGYSYLTSHGFRAEHIVRIPNGIDTEKFRPERRPDATKPEREIICVARLEYAKGVDVLLHAWARMMREPAVWRTQLKPRLRLVGDGVFRSQMERIVAALDIQESVEFLGLRTDIIAILQHAWGFALPSRWEGMPNALLEAMACGLPCVATRVSGSEDIIRDGVNGLLVEPEHPAKMAKALRCIIEDSELAQQLGQEGRATILRDYQLNDVVKKCLEFYCQLLTRERTPISKLRKGKM